MAATTLIESTYQDGKPIVDRDAGVIRGVKILGRFSRNGDNGREYSNNAMKQAAVMYEGLGVNTNHPDRSTPRANRDIQEGIGWLENVTVKDDGVYGDLALIKSHPMANPLFEVAERNPKRFGLSHNASGDSVDRGGRRLVESITTVRSVDVVQNPATNQSLFESEDPVATTTTLKDLMESLPAKSRERKGLMDLMEMDGMPMVSGDMPVDMPMADGAEASPEDAVKAAFKAAMVAILDDETLDQAQTLEKLKAMLTAKESALGLTSSAESTDTGVQKGDPMTESLQEQVDALKAKLDDKEASETARALLESKGIAVKQSRIATLKSTTDKAVRTELLEDWLKADGPKQKASVARPARSAPVPLMESEGDSGHKPAKGADAMIRAYR